MPYPASPNTAIGNSPQYVGSSPTYSVSSSISSSISYQVTPPSSNNVPHQMQEKITNLERQLSKEQEESRKLYNERTQLTVALNSTKQQNAIAVTEADVRLASMREDLQWSERRSRIWSDHDRRENQKLQNVIKVYYKVSIMRLEEKNKEQEVKIKNSEKAELLRKEQQQKNKAAGILMKAQQKAMEAATGSIKKRKRKPGSKKKPSSTESIEVNVLINDCAPVDFNGHFFDCGLLNCKFDLFVI